MNLTSKQLKQIIMEELTAVVEEKNLKNLKTFKRAIAIMLEAGWPARELIDIVKGEQDLRQALAFRRARDQQDG